MDEIVIAPAVPDDAGELLTVQRAAYLSEAQLYGETRLPPLTETLDDLRGSFAVPGSLVLKAVRGARLVGSVRSRAVGDVLHIGRLSVAPDLQGLGIGTRLLQAVQAAADPAVTTFTLFTGHLSEANLRLYRRLGYVETHRERPHGVELVHLTRPRVLPAPAAGPSPG